MHDFDQFERRLAAALRSDADRGVVWFDPASVARIAIGSARPRSYWARLRPVLQFGRPSTRVLYLLVVIGVVLALIAGAIVAGALRPRPIVGSGWTATSAMTKARTDHTATLLLNGKVLVAGGSDGGTVIAPSAELFDPETRSWTATGSMAQGRQGHTATLLRDGRVLVAGGSGAQGATLASAELYDPARGSWTATGSMGDARADHTATLLPDGRVLVIGGFGRASAELYDPRTETWTSTGAMDHDRAYHTATLLPDGKVLVVGGFSDTLGAIASAELFDPGTGTWTSAPGMVQPRFAHTATLLSDGRVLVVGGSIAGGSFQPTASAELYEPGTGAWTAAGSMKMPRVYAAATLMPDGSVLLAGGFSGTSNNEPAGPMAAELFDPTSGSWTVTNPMTQARTLPTATLLADGTVLVTGGRARPVLAGAIASAELYDPGSRTR